MRQDSDLLLNLHGVVPNRFQVSSDRIIVSSLIDIVLSSREGEAVMVMVVGDRELLLVVQVLLILLFNLFEVIEDLSNLFLISRNALI